MNEILYINSDESFGNETLVGTRAEFRRALGAEGGGDCWTTWYRDYATFFDGDGDPMSLEEYIEDALDAHLTEATPEDIARFERITRA